MNKHGLWVLVVVAATLVVGCGVRKDSQTVNSANGHMTCTQTRQGLVCNNNSEAQFSDCMRNNSPTMGSSHADAYCRCVTTGGTVVPSQHPQLPPTCVAAGGAGYGAGMAYGGYPGYLPGPRGAVMLPDPTPPGAVAMENNSRGARVYVLPGSPVTGTTAGPDAGAQDIEDLARATKANRDAICRANPSDPMCCTSCKK